MTDRIGVPSNQRTRCKKSRTDVRRRAAVGVGTGVLNASTHPSAARGPDHRQPPATDGAGDVPARDRHQTTRVAGAGADQAELRVRERLAAAAVCDDPFLPFTRGLLDWGEICDRVVADPFEEMRHRTLE